MSMALAGVTDSPPHTSDHSKFPVAANVLSLQARRDLRRSAMIDNTEGLQVELRRDKKRLKLLLELASDAVSNQELHSLVKAIMMRIKSALDSDGVCILLKRQKEGALDLYALDFRSKGSSLNETTLMPLAGTIASYVLGTGKPWAGTREQARALYPNDLLLKEQFSSGCMLSLSGCNRVVGTLALVRTRHNPYSQNELDFLA